MSKSPTAAYAEAHIANMFQGASVTQPIAGQYRALPASYRELREYAKAYHGHGWSPRDATRLALDTIAPYHELFRSH